MEYSDCIVCFRVEYLSAEGEIVSRLINVFEKEGNTDKGRIHAHYKLEEYLRSPKAARCFPFRFDDVVNIVPVFVDYALA